MFPKYRFVKKLYISSSFTNARPLLCSFSLLYHKFPLQTLNLSKISIYSFSTSQEKEDPCLLKGLTPWQKEKMGKILDEYALHKEDLGQLTSDEVKWILSGLSDLSRAHLHNKSGHNQAYDCLSERDYIFRKLGIKDNIDVALNSYGMASILIEQKRFEEAKKYLNEVGRICKLLNEDPQTKSLKVQRWYLLAQIESQFSQDKALELYNSVLENIGDVSKSALPAILLSVHKEMAEIYRARGDTDNMIKSWEDALQAVMESFKGNSTIDMNFLGDIVDKNVFAEPSTENSIKMVLKSFPDPLEKVGIICCLVGNIFFDNRKYAQAVNAYEEAFKIFDSLPKDYSSLLYDVYFSMAKAQGYSKDSQAGYFLKKAEGAIANVEQNLNVAAVYCRWAKICSSELDPFRTEDYYTKALELYKTLDPSNKAKIFSIYEGWGEIIEGLYWGLPMEEEIGWESAVEVWKEAEKYLDPTDHRTVQKLYINLEFLYYNLGDREEGEKCLQKILQSCEATGDTSYAFACYYQTGESNEKQGNLREALVCYETAARVYEKDANKDVGKAQNFAAKISQIKEKLQIT